MICPKYSINGTATASLAEDAAKAASALRAALLALREIAPNGRDYVYDGRLKDAQTEWQSLYDSVSAALESVKDYQMALSDRPK